MLLVRLNMCEQTSGVWHGFNIFAYTFLGAHKWIDLHFMIKIVMFNKLQAEAVLNELQPLLKSPTDITVCNSFHIIYEGR